jgi:hypothetical protein
MANTDDDALRAIPINRDGTLGPPVSTPSGGDQPWDVEVAFDDIVLVANRGSSRVNMFTINRQGDLIPVGDPMGLPTGDVPHAVSISRRGLVAVANHPKRSVDLYELDRRGNASPLGFIDLSDAGELSPFSITWGRNNLHVGLLDVVGFQDQESRIRTFHFGRGDGGEWTSESVGDTLAGRFLTDLQANKDRLFAATLGDTDPDMPGVQGSDEIGVYEIGRRGELTQDASIFTPGQPLSNKRLATADFGDDYMGIMTTEFHSDTMRSLLYGRR